VGEGILQQERTPLKQEQGITTTEQRIEKANSLLEEVNREERSGFKAEHPFGSFAPGIGS